MKEIESHSGKNIADLFCSTRFWNSSLKNWIFHYTQCKQLLAHVINLVVKDFLNEKDNGRRASTHLQSAIKKKKEHKEEEK